MAEQVQRAVRRRSRGRRAPFRLGLLAAAALLGGRLAHAGPPARTRFERALATPIKELDLRNKSPLEGLFDLVYKYQLPTGIEYIDSNLVRGRANLYLANTTARSAIADIIKQVPGYRVDFSHGLVDVYSPQARRDPLSALNLTIRSFRVARVDAGDATHRLQDEVFAKLHPGVGFGGDYATGETSPSRPVVTLSLGSRKVYQVMNAIVAKDGAAVWLVLAHPEELDRFRWNQWWVYNLNPQGEAFILEYLSRLFPPSSQVHP